MKTSLTVFVAVFIAWFTVNGQNLFHTFDQFDKSVGVPEGITWMDQDEEGLYWLATSNGLYRFDGVQAVEVNYLPSDTLPPTARKINMLSIDTVHQLIWLATGAGMFRYHKNTGKSDWLDAQRIYKKEEQRRVMAAEVFTDRQGETWAYFAVRGLTKLPLTGDDLKVYSLPVSPEEVDIGLDFEKSNKVTCLEQDVSDDDILWIGTGCGLMKFDKKSGLLTRYYYRVSDPILFIHSNGITSLYAHTDGKIYLGTWNGGLLVFNPVTGEFRPFLISPKGWTRLETTNQVNTLLPDDKGGLWVSGHGGIHHFDTHLQKFASQPEDARLHFKDRQGHYWALGKTLKLYHRIKNQLPHYQIPPSVQCEGFLGGIAFDADHRCVYYHSTCQDGLYAMDVDRHTWRLLPVWQGESRKFVTYGATTRGYLIKDKQGRFYLREKGADQFRMLPLSIPDSAGHLEIASRDDDHLFLSGHEGFLYWFKPGDWTPVVFNGATAKEPAPGYFQKTTAEIFDAQGNLWISTAGGVSLFSPDENRFTHYIGQKGVRYSRYLGFVTDPAGKIWVSENSEFGWINPLHPEAGMQKRYNRLFRFPTNQLAIAICEKDRIWIGSDKGVMAVNPEKQEYRFFDFLKTNSIASIGDKKAIVFYQNGYSVFHTDSLIDNREKPRPYISSLKVYSRSMPLQGPAFQRAKVRLKADENFITIGFSALSIYEPGRLKFAYLLQGLSHEWITADPGNFTAVFTNIPGGNYIFKVKVTDENGVWVETLAVLYLHVGTPWYKSTLAYIIYLLLAIAGGYTWYRFQKHRWELKASLKNQLQESKRLADLDQFKNRFFTNITHEFRTPLTVILGMAEEMSEKLADPVSAREFRSKLHLIHRNGENLLRLVNQILDLSRIESSVLNLQYRQSDIMFFLKITVEGYQSHAASKKIHIACQYEPRSFIMDFDTLQLQKIVDNLMSNAIRYSPENGVITFTCRLSENLTNGASAGLQLIFEIKDEGPGISPEDQELVFDRFYQSGGDTVRHSQGSGIGLALVRELVHLMKGEIRVQSEPDKGCLFRIVLPVTNVAPLQLEETTPMPRIRDQETLPANAVSENGQELPLLLLVEDHPDLLHYLQLILQGKYRVIHAGNGRKGLEMALAQVPDIVLSDVMMPEMNGLEMCQALKQDTLTSHIPVILLTAKTTMEDRLAGLTEGTDAYLTKPFHREELLLTLKNQLENRMRIAAYIPSNQQEITPLMAKEHHFVLQLQQIIDTHIENENFDIPLLSREMAMSRMQLHRKLTALMGISATQFVRKYRLAKAKTLLETTSLSISEIGYQTGFSDPAYFSKCYREEYGVTPGQLRK